MWRSLLGNILGCWFYVVDFSKICDLISDMILNKDVFKSNEIIQEIEHLDIESRVFSLQVFPISFTYHFTEDGKGGQRELLAKMLSNGFVNSRLGLVTRCEALFVRCPVVFLLREFEKYGLEAEQTRHKFRTHFLLSFWMFFASPGHATIINF